MLINGKLECNWYIRVTRTLILNVFIVISAITMNARGNREWLTSCKLCYNLFKKFSFKMRQSKCCWLIRGKSIGECVWVLFPYEGSYGDFVILLWLGWVTPSLLPSFFLMKALGLDLWSLQWGNFSASLQYFASVTCSVCLWFVAPLWGWSEKLLGVSCLAGPCVQKTRRRWCKTSGKTWN